MGSSNKKKREKKKDFQKPKLKVGKARPRPANQTDTSFRSKAIVLNQQSLSVAAPSSSSQFSHHLSLLTSRSDSQRRDALSFLITYASSKPVDASLPVPTAVILPKICPLILDASEGVRTRTLKLFQALPSNEVSDHASEILPYIRAGMTHLAVSIRTSAIEVLSWLNMIAGDELVSCAGGWVKTLNCLITVLGWQGQNSAQWKTTFGKAGSEGKPMARSIEVLGEFLRSGICPTSTADEEVSVPSTFPYWHIVYHQIPTKSNAYGYLNLYGEPEDDESKRLEDETERARVFDVLFRAPIEQGLEASKQEGGTSGRAAAAVSKTLRDAVRTPT